MGILSSIFGKRPVVPPFDPISIDEQQTGAIEGNINAVGKAAELARLQQEADQENLLGGIRAAFPGYDDYVSGTTDVIQQLMSGEVPEQVRRQIQNQRAAMGVSTGTSGSQRLEFSTARDLGLTSLDLTMKGLQTGSQFFQQQRAGAVAAPMSVTSMFQSPAARLAHATSERSMRFQRDYAANKVAASPSPVASSLFNIGMAMVGGMVGGPAGAAVGSGASTGGFSGLNSSGQGMTYRNPQPSYL